MTQLYHCLHTSLIFRYQYSAELDRAINRILDGSILVKVEGCTPDHYYCRLLFHDGRRISFYRSGTCYGWFRWCVIDGEERYSECRPSAKTIWRIIEVI